MLCMARCYPWRDVISTIHDDMLSMARIICHIIHDLYHVPWRYVVHGAMLSMLSRMMYHVARCYLWRDVIITIHDEMVSNISESFVTSSTILLSRTTSTNVFRYHGYVQCCRRWCSRGHQLPAEWRFSHSNCLTIRHRRTHLNPYRMEWIPYCISYGISVDNIKCEVWIVNDLVVSVTCKT